MSRRPPTGGTVSARSARAFARRSRSRRLLRLRPVLAVLAVLGLAAVAGWAVLASPLLAVDQVRVVVSDTGTDRVDPGTVRRLAAVPAGRPLARLDLDAIGARVRTLPGVADVSVSRSWPSTVVVRVTARTPVAAIRQGTAYALVDAEGVAFQQVAAIPARLPLIVLGLHDRDDSLRAALDVVTALPAGMRVGVLRVTAPTPEQVTLNLRSGRVVVWGGVDRSPRKALVLAALLKVPAAVYDVSAPDEPTTRGKP